MENLITIVIPFHNNADGIMTSVNAIENSKFRSIIKEIILCHNGPRVEEFEKVKLASRNFSSVKVLHDLRPGLGHGCRMGVEIVSSPFLLITGADLPFGFTDLEKWIELYKNNKMKDVVIGSKLHPESLITGRTLMRSLSTACYQLVKSFIIPFSIPKDTQGTIFMSTAKARPISRETISEGFFYTSELVILAINTGADFLEVPVVYISNEKQSSVNPLKEGVRFVRSLISLRKKIKGSK